MDTKGTSTTCQVAWGPMGPNLSPMCPMLDEMWLLLSGLVSMLVGRKLRETNNQYHNAGVESK